MATSIIRLCVSIAEEHFGPLVGVSREILEERVRLIVWIPMLTSTTRHTLCLFCVYVDMNPRRLSSDPWARKGDRRSWAFRGLLD